MERYRFNRALSKELLIFVLEVGSEDVFANIIKDLLPGPEAAAIELILAWLDWTIVDAAMDIDQLTLTLAFKDIVTKRLGLEVSDAKFLTDLTVQGLVYILAEVNMTAYGRIPLVRLDIFPCGAMLEVELALTVEDMKVNDGMKDLTAVVGVSATDGSENVPVFIHDRELLIGIVLHNV